MLVNDWSARDIQGWEYQPLGPFLSKSFATSISPWVVPAAALERHRVTGPVQAPAPLPYLARVRAVGARCGARAGARRRRRPARVIARTNARELYWTAAQQLTHAASNGAVVRAGDLFASGTISGSKPGTQGSLIELAWNGQRPLEIDGATRSFLEDGDTVTISGWSGEGAERIDFGEVSGTILPAG